MAIILEITFSYKISFNEESKNLKIEIFIDKIYEKIVKENKLLKNLIEELIEKFESFNS